MDTIRRIPASTVSDAVCGLFITANHRLSEDVSSAIGHSSACENSSLAKSVLGVLLDNLAAAESHNVPVCQDTGMAVLFAEVGSLVHIEGDTLENAVNIGVSRAYLEGKMRCSVVRDPFYNRQNTGDNTPAILHIRSVPGDRLRLIAAPKGFGSENMSALRMFTPSMTEEMLIAFVCETVKKAGSNPCPPLTLGIGIGGDFERCTELAKFALTRPLTEHNPDPKYAALEEKMLKAVNDLGIGPQGFGGNTTALSLRIETAPTHIAGLPVAVNINCHVARHQETVL